MRPVILSVLLVAGASFARAEDITTTERKVFKNAEVIRFEPDGLVIKHDGGTNWIGWKDLPTATRKRFQTEARKRKEEEIQKLKRDLARAEAEAARLKEDNGQPETGKRPQAEKSGGLSARRTTGEERGRPLVELPPLKPDDIVDAAELVQQFKNDPTATDRRYDKKTFRVKGVIERFEPRMFVRKYDVLLESADRFVRVVAVFDYPNDYKTVFTTRRGQTLVGKPAENKEVTLLQAGQAIVLRGKCKGGRDTEIVFTGCELVH